MFGQEVVGQGVIKAGVLATLALDKPIFTKKVDESEAVKSSDKWDNSLTSTLIELSSIKSMAPTEIPAAINELFAVQASREVLGDFEGSHIPGRLNRVFITTAMDTMFRRLGSGAHSIAYALDDQWVIKINCNDPNYELADGAFDWLMACTGMQGNIFVPRIASLHQEGLMYTAVVERLGENTLYAAPDGGCFLDLAAEQQIEEFDFGQYMTEMVDYPTFLLMGCMGRDDLIQLAAVYDATQVATDAGDDLVDFNIMLRDGVPVINDPFGDSNSGLLAAGKSYSWKMCNA